MAAGVGAGRACLQTRPDLEHRAVGGAMDGRALGLREGAIHREGQARPAVIDGPQRGAHSESERRRRANEEGSAR
eukprot:8430931-Alexandrium_andersonii.AAC.2